MPGRWTSASVAASVAALGLCCAAAAVQRFDRKEAGYKRDLEQCKDPKREAELRRRPYGPQEPKEGRKSTDM